MALQTNRQAMPGLHAAARGLTVAVLLVLLGAVTAVGPVLANSTAEPAAATAGPPVVRRLTESEYRATIADIFGRDVPVVGRFEPGLRSNGLIAVGTSEAGLSAFAIEQYDASARGIARAVLSEEHRDAAVPCTPQSENRFDRDCAAKFVERFGQRLFRRPLTPAETSHHLAVAQRAQEQLGSFYSGLEFALSGLLVSPEFLLRIEQVEPDPDRPGEYRLDSYSRATRMSYLVTGSTPDEELLRAAGAGELDTGPGVAQQVDRLMASPRFNYAVRSFFEDMLQFDLFEDLAKDPLIYPTYNSVVAADAQEQTLRTIADHLLVQEKDYRDLFTTRTAILTRSLGTVYRMPVASRNGWEMKVFSDNSGRAGIQSHISFLALHSHPGRSSPTLRGQAMREVFLCQVVPDPPVDVDFTGINDTSNKARPTARDRLEAHQTQPACEGCHTLMDPLGLTLEKFDGVGLFRSKENGAVIDVSGSLDGREFVAATGLGQALRDHPQTPRCLVTKMYRAAVGRLAVPAEQPYINYLNQQFAEQGYKVPALIRAIAVSDTFYGVTPTGGMANDQGVADTRAADADVERGDQS